MLIAHLSDLHVEPEGRLYKGLVDTNALLDLALDTLLALRPAPDLVIIGGDVVEDGSDAAYEAAARRLARLPMPIFAIPGNHDDRAGFRRRFAGAWAMPEDGPAHFDTGRRWPLRAIGLDVTVPGAHHGEVDAAAADWLAARLDADPDRPTVVLMHHPPIETGIGFIDACRCFGEARLAQALRGRDQVRRVLCGHVHRDVEASFAGIPLTIAPSTGSAIALALAEDAAPASFLEPPGALLHRWSPGGGLVSHRIALGRHPGPLPFF